MDIYTYIASSNPYQAKSILHKYGYSAKDVRTQSDLGSCLKKLVTYEGEDALIDILDSHPDKGVIIERYLEKQKREEYKNADGADCGCKALDKNIEREQYSNFLGSESKSTKDVSMYILAASLLLAAAIIVKK